MSSEKLDSIPPTTFKRPALAPLQSLDFAEKQPEDYDNDDIYRGERPSNSRPSSIIRSQTSTSSSASSSSSSSSSGTFLAGARLGTIAALLEQAITRWARRKRNSSSASSSSSSSSARSSVITASRGHLSRQRKRRSSIASLQTLQSEKDIAARISRMKALEVSRQIPRHFILYLPPTLRTLHTSGRFDREARNEHVTQGIIWTSSLSTVLNQLENALKKASKWRRHHGRTRINPISSPDQSATEARLHPVVVEGKDINRQLHFEGLRTRRRRKGKQREGPAGGKHYFRVIDPNLHSHMKASKAWFLDVASPTWEDLQKIGKLLHLHPLTLEDILQQDPREKLDLFPKLGYYFVSFRAIESRAVRHNIHRQLQQMNEFLEPIAGHGEGAIGAANVYLVVFPDGICCFHHTDISEHTERVRDRITRFEDIENMSSDWIAHGLLDSIIDSFFPYLEEIEKEVVATEELIVSPNLADDMVNNDSETQKTVNNTPQNRVAVKEKLGLPTSTEARSLPLSEKHSDLGKDTRPRFAIPRWTIPLFFRRARRFFIKSWRGRSKSAAQTQPSSTTLTLRRMARTRRIVTSLTRLLATKSDVITQIQKRLLSTGAGGFGNGNSKTDEFEVAIYMGDIQDHILTLQHSLNHYERMLSESHPTYLSQLRTSYASAKSGTDMALIYLTTVSIAVISLQSVTGMFSMNIQVPSNGPGVHNLFGIVICIAFVVLMIYLSIVRHWWIQAKRNCRALSKI